ncbi:SDR family oxidoreductase [Capsulimonas corticalis]|uniref:SDR family oxidoreductase n=1 Tax=Capsulimonas corticalis TaxID=2219043 RepID=UPI000E65C862
MENKKIALITGANRGIGLETARQLAQQGVKVLLGARSADKGAAAAETLKAEGLDVEFLRIDVDDAATHASAAKHIEETFGKLDILVNNAGISGDEQENGAIVQASKTSPAVLRRVFDTNFFNTVAVTQALLPLVQKSDAGRIVFLSSILGSLTLHNDPNSPIYNFKVPAYDISKTALNGYVVHLAHELKDTPIKVNAAHPGSVVTDMNANGDIPVEEGAKTSVLLALLPDDGYSGKFIYLGDELPW